MSDTVILPSRQTAFLDIQELSGITIPGVSNDLKFDGTSDFTVAFWVRIDDTSRQPYLFYCENSLCVFLMDGQVTVYFSQQPSIPLFSGGPVLGETEPGVQTGKWSHIAVAIGTHPEGVGEDNPGDGRVISIFVDGVWVGYEPVPEELASSNVGNDVFLMATDSELQFRSLQIFDYGLNEAQVNSLKFKGENNIPPVPAVIDYNFGTCPPTLSGNTQALPYIQQYFGTLGTSFATPAQPARPSSGDTANPADGINSFSVQTWFYVNMGNSSISSNVFSNGTGGSAYVSIRVQPQGSSMRLSVTYGGSAYNASVPTNSWCNVAITYDNDSDLLKIYINGNHVSSATVHSSQTRGVPYMAFGNFPGYLQNVNIWNRALSEEEVQTNLRPFNAVDDDSITALYDFTNAPISNLLTGAPINYYVNYVTTQAPIEQVIIPATPETAPPLEEQMMVVKQQKKPKSKPAFLVNPPAIQSASGFAGLDYRKIDKSHFSNEKLKEALEEIYRTMPRTWTAAQRAEFRQSAKEHMSAVYKAAANGELKLDTLITHERIGDDQVFFHHVNGKQVAVARTTSAYIDDCLAWKISVVATGLFGLLSLFNVPTSTGSVTKILNKLIGKSTVLATAFGSVLESSITAYSIIELVNVLYDNGYFWTFIDDILDSLSYFDYLFFAVELGFEIVSLLAPEATIAIILLKLQVAAAQLVYVYTQQPSGCHWS